MLDVTQTISPKSDQLNADDLISGPRVLHITGVRLLNSDQPVAINFDGDNGKPYKPCKSMRRVMVAIWGADASKWAGQSIEVYRDDSVQFGGAAVGGIRISKATGISKPMDLLLTVKRSKRAQYRITPLTATQAAPAQQPTYPDERFLAELDKMQAAIASGRSTVDQVVAHLEKTGTVSPEQRAMLTAAPVAEPDDDDDEF